MAIFADGKGGHSYSEVMKNHSDCGYTTSEQAAANGSFKLKQMKEDISSDVWLKRKIVETRDIGVSDLDFLNIWAPTPNNWLSKDVLETIVQSNQVVDILKDDISIKKINLES